VEYGVDEVRRELDAKIERVREEVQRAVHAAVAPLSAKLDGLAAEFVRMRQEAVASLDRRIALAEARLDGKVQACRDCRAAIDHRFDGHSRESGETMNELATRLEALEKEQIRHGVYWRIVQVAQALVTSGVGLYFVQSALKRLFG